MQINKTVALVLVRDRGTQIPGVTIDHLRVTMGHLRFSIGYL